MADAEDLSSKFEKLRMQAEELIRQQGQRPGNSSSSAMLDLIQAIKSYQAELEAKNQELRQAHQALAKLQEEYKALYEFAPCAYVTLDSNAMITRANLAAVRLLGEDKGNLLNADFSQILAPGQAGQFQAVLVKARETGERQCMEAGLKAGNEFSPWARLIIEADQDPERAGLQWRMALVDITARKQTEAALRKSREDYETLLVNPQHISAYKEIIGKSPSMREILTLVQRLASVNTTVLITGESGTGKELIANALHGAGRRADGPLVKVNCSALSESLLESELFGHVRGAFTGATARKAGRIESAEGGSLFLDEIGDISPSLQLKLLRFLQEKQFERVGEAKTLNADVRIIAATNADLSLKVKNGLFREDLYYRLKVIEIYVPPLRERSEDIPLFVRHFCRHFGKSFNKPISGVSDGVMRIFMEYQWPGNVRELKHALEHGVLLCPDEEIEVCHLPKELASPADHAFTGWPAGIKIDREVLLQALHDTSGNKAAAARKLGISRRTMYRKLHEFGLMGNARL